MNRVELPYEPYGGDPGHRTFSLMGSAGLLTCGVVMLIANSAPIVLSDAQVYEYVSPLGQASLTNVPTNERVTIVRRKARYHSGVADLELEQAVDRAAPRSTGLAPRGDEGRIIF